MCGLICVDLQPGGPCDLFSALPAGVCPVLYMGYMGPPLTRTPIHIGTEPSSNYALGVLSYLFFFFLRSYHCHSDSFAEKVATIAFNMLVAGGGPKRWWFFDCRDTTKVHTLSVFICGIHPLSLSLSLLYLLYVFIPKYLRFV